VVKIHTCIQKVSIAAAYALLTSYGMKHHKEATDALLSGYMKALPLSKVEVCIVFLTCACGCGLFCFNLLFLHMFELYRYVQMKKEKKNYSLCVQNGIHFEVVSPFVIVMQHIYVPILNIYK
jgi:hypothetical protein